MDIVALSHPIRYVGKEDRASTSAATHHQLQQQCDNRKYTILRDCFLGWTMTWHVTQSYGARRLSRPRSRWRTHRSSDQNSSHSREAPAFRCGSTILTTSSLSRLEWGTSSSGRQPSGRSRSTRIITRSSSLSYLSPTHSLLNRLHQRF